MAEAKGRDNWQHTSAMLAFIGNSNPFRKGKPAAPAEFNPYTAKAKEKTTRLEPGPDGGMDILLMLFCPRPKSP